MGRATFTRRMAEHTDEWPVKDVKAVCKYLGIPKEELIKTIRLERRVNVVLIPDDPAIREIEATGYWPQNQYEDDGDIFASYEGDYNEDTKGDSDEEV